MNWNSEREKYDEIGEARVLAYQQRLWRKRDARDAAEAEPVPTAIAPKQPAKQPPVQQGARVSSWWADRYARHGGRIAVPKGASFRPGNIHVGRHQFSAGREVAMAIVASLTVLGVVPTLPGAYIQRGVLNTTGLSPGASNTIPHGLAHIPQVVGINNWGPASAPVALNSSLGWSTLRATTRDGTRRTFTSSPAPRRPPAS